MISVFEPCCKGLTHVAINSAILKIVRESFVDEEVVFWAEKSHIAEVNNQLNPKTAASISFQSIELPFRKSPILLDLISEHRFLWSMIHRARKSRLLIFTSIEALPLFALKVCIRGAGSKALAVLHSPLKQIGGWRSNNPLIRLVDFKAALSFPMSKDKIRYLVLEKSIRYEMLKIIPSLRSRVDVISHPVPSEERELPELSLLKPLKFGYVGLATKSRGFDLFLEAAKSVKSKFRGRVEFHSIGSVGNGQAWPGSDVLDTEPACRKLQRDDYVRRVKQMHFLCFPYEIDHYRLVASGALLDAVAFEKPIIATRCPIITDMERECGSIGYLFDGRFEFEKILSALVERGKDDRYGTFIKSLRCVKLYRTPENLVPAFKKVVGASCGDVGSSEFDNV